VVPVRLKADDRFCFSCHPGVACWNVCCHGADVTLTPHDIVRLCAKLDLRPTAFLERHTVPTLWDTAGLPVAKLKMGGDDGSGPCPFLADEGCTVYAERPATCRYYPLGLARIKPKGAEREDEFHFLVKEPFCRGHDEDKVQPVEAFRREQQVADNERVDRGWMEILMKMASWKTVGGPHGKDLTPQTKQMFFMVSTDVDGLRSFVFGTKFLDTYEVAPETVELIRNDDQALLRLGFDWMKNVIFNEPTITLKDAVLRDAVAKAREEMGGM
jgi:Fe-S-cluster containining protein